MIGIANLAASVHTVYKLCLWHSHLSEQAYLNHLIRNKSDAFARMYKYKTLELIWDIYFQEPTSEYSYSKQYVLCHTVCFLCFKWAFQTAWKQRWSPFISDLWLCSKPTHAQIALSCAPVNLKWSRAVLPEKSYTTAAQKTHRWDISSSSLRVPPANKN